MASADQTLDMVHAGRKILQYRQYILNSSHLHAHMAPMQNPTPYRSSSISSHGPVQHRKQTHARWRDPQGRSTFVARQLWKACVATAIQKSFNVHADTPMFPMHRWARPACQARRTVWLKILKLRFDGTCFCRCGECCSLNRALCNECSAQNCILSTGALGLLSQSGASLPPAELSRSITVCTANSLFCSPVGQLAVLRTVP